METLARRYETIRAHTEALAAPLTDVYKRQLPAKSRD